MPPITDTDLAEILGRRGYRISRSNSPRTDPNPQTATQPRPEPVSPDRANVASKDKPSGNQKQLALAMSEDDLQTSVIDLAHLYHWKVAHFRSVRVQKQDGTVYWQTPVAADGEGWPDLVLARADPAGGLGRVLVVECKKEKERPRPSQTEWLSLLILSKRVEVYVWKPSMWLDGTIEALLR